MVMAAERARVRRFVFSSVIHPTLGALPNHAAKVPVEDVVLNSGMEYCLLHPAMFFQNFTWRWATVLEQGILAEPWSTETRFSRVEYRDVAEVAAVALTEERLLGGTFELCAEGHPNRTEIAELVSSVLGRPIEVRKSERTPPGAARAGSETLAMKAMFEWYDTHSMVGNALTLRAILGREPRSLQAYFQECAVASATRTGVRSVSG